MPFILMIVSGERKGERFPVVEGRAITLGRDAANTICLPDRKLSRIHCQIDAIGDRCQVVDLNSTNGTLVNGQRITTETWIGVEDEVEIGMTRMRLAVTDKRAGAGLVAAGSKPVKPVLGARQIRCEECGRKISGAELDGGKARHVGDRYYCSDCTVSLESQTASDLAQVEPVVAPPAPRFEPGEEVASVRTISMIGEGRLGPLYKGEQTSMGRLVALKILNVTDGEWAKSYLNAVYMSGQLVHPNIVLIFDTGEEEGFYYIVREYVEGQSVQQRLVSRKPVPLSEAFAVITQVAYALEYAFERHIFHGGLSPRKILLGARDTVKVTGFGLPQALPPGHPVTPHARHALVYTAPERLREGTALDFAGDVYSLVAVLYHLLAGRAPFSGSTRQRLERRIRKRTPRRLSEFNADLPPAVQKIVDRGLSKDPRARYQLPRELIYDLDENLRREM